jgi:hypothetical protein
MTNSHEITDTESEESELNIGVLTKRSVKMFGMSIDDIERKMEEHSIFGKDHVFMSTGILSDIQEVLSGLDDPTGALEITRQRLNIVKYILGQDAEARDACDSSGLKNYGFER